MVVVSGKCRLSGHRRGIGEGDVVLRTRVQNCYAVCDFVGRFSERGIHSLFGWVGVDGIMLRGGRMDRQTNFSIIFDVITNCVIND